MTGTDLLQLCLRLGLTPLSVWHCFSYGKAGDIQMFIQEWQNRDTWQGHE